MNTLVIGGYGFIGQEIVHELLKRGDRVTIADSNINENKIQDARYIKVDITQPGAIRKAIEDIDEVYHIAAMLGTSELNGITSIRDKV